MKLVVRLSLDANVFDGEAGPAAAAARLREAATALEGIEVPLVDAMGTVHYFRDGRKRAGFVSIES
jgi:hypothetical protein